MSTPVVPKVNHGFHLFGAQSLLLAHIPMFMAPHQAQLFLEVGLSTSDGKNAAPIYLKDKKKTGTLEYVLVSDPLVLPTLAPDAPNRLQAFTGNLYRGWPFDKQWHLNPAQLLIPNVKIKVTRAIHYSSIATPITLKGLSYYCFQTPKTAYLAHVLSRPPDFTHLLTAKVTGLGNQAGQGAIRLQFPGVANTVGKRLLPTQQASALTSPGGKSVKVQVNQELNFDDDPQHLGETMPSKMLSKTMAAAKPFQHKGGK